MSAEGWGERLPRPSWTELTTARTLVFFLIELVVQLSEEAWCLLTEQLMEELLGAGGP